MKSAIKEDNEIRKLFAWKMDEAATTIAMSVTAVTIAEIIIFLLKSITFL
jgi:hypothetical protein